MGKIISVTDGIVLSNDRGARLEIYEHDGKYGLGTFYFDGKKLGGCADTFLFEDFHYEYEKYQADRYEIIENTEEKGVITFYGTIGVHNIESNWLATITLTADQPAYRINLQVEPYLWPGRYHALCAAVSFNNEAMKFVSYPMEESLTGHYEGHFSITPDRGKVPFLLACERIRDQEVYVGIGYSLDHPQDYTQGALRYDTTRKGRCLIAEFPYRSYWIPAKHTWEAMCELTPDNFEDSVMAPKDGKNYFRHGEPYELDLIVSTAATQADCVFAYMKSSGFNTDTEVKHDSIKVTDNMLLGFGNVAETSYIPGVGYRMRGWSNSNDKANYYDYVNFAWNMSLAVLLYQLWKRDRTQEWARTRAIEMADFYVEKQLPNGASARCWHPELQVLHGIGDDYHEFGCVYCAMTAAMCAALLDELNDLRIQTEGIENKDWEAAAEKSMEWVLHLTEKDGHLLHSYTIDEIGTLNAINAHALYALDHFLQKTRDPKYEKALLMNEAYLYDTFGQYNNWYNGINDCNTLRAPITGVQYHDHSTLHLFDLGAYYIQRYNETGEDHYLQKAKDMLAFGWLGRMPINMPGWEHRTKGIMEEQNVWVFYDAPWVGEGAVANCGGFQMMARLSEDPFYAEYFKVLLHTELDFIRTDDLHPFSAQTLSAEEDKRMPRDCFAEVCGDKCGVWITGHNSMFLCDIFGSYIYYYLGGKNWGVGLDYDPDFDPDFGEKPYLRAASSRVYEAAWEKETFRCVLEGRKKENCEVIFRTLGGEIPKQIRLDGKTVQADLTVDEKRKELVIRYDQTAESMSLEVEF